MNPQIILAAVLQYGPSILPVIQQIATWIKENKTEVTKEDLDALIAYGAKKAADYL